MATADARRYSTVAMILHWVIAAAIVGQIGLGWYMGSLERGQAQFELFQLHKSVGLTILLLTLVRIGWRLTHKPPPYAAGVRGWQHTLASAVHAGFYVLLLLLPMSGWALVSASPYNIPTLFWEVVEWPHLPGLANLPAAEKEAASGDFEAMHEWLVRLILALLALHVAGALKHQLVDRDGTLWRMLPFGRVEPRA